MKLLSFRIFDFKSIRDSGECSLSADNITVLAGQNESGKTAVLSALRDFDLPPNKKPLTPDYLPEDRFDADPKVSVFFAIDEQELKDILKEEKREVPSNFFDEINKDKGLRITRQLLTGTFYLDPKFDQMWPLPDIMEEASDSEEHTNTDNSEYDDSDVFKDSNVKDSTDDSIGVSSAPFSNSHEFAELLHNWWPGFVYFDSFHDLIPRSVNLADLVPSNQPSSQSSASGKPSKLKTPQSVHDFITQSGMDLDKVSKFIEQEKILSNYLTSCSAKISGDFLHYWKQRDGSETVQLQVRHERDAEGKSQLAFYIHDKVNQYPEQRSKGFVWFLSFYLRLAAAHTRESREQRTRILLIDEPGTYLHARAQRDVLNLFEDRLAKKDQIIYSTHSPFLLPADRLHRVRIALKIEDKGTLVLERLTHPILRTGDFSDTLSPILTAVGIEITGTFSAFKEKNILVEGISDHYYLNSWKKILNLNNWDFSIFPCTGASSVVTFSSLMIGLGLKFVILLDHDDQGKSAKEKLQHELGISSSSIVQPKGAAGLEDVFSADDFREVLKELDPELKLEAGESPTGCIRRLKIDKVLLSRKYAELVSSGKFLQPTKKTMDAAVKLFNDFDSAWENIAKRGSSLALFFK